MNSHIKRQAADDGATELLLDWLGRHRLGSVVTSGALSVIPVYCSEAADATGYRTLSEAIALGEVLVNERSQASVGELRVVNNGALPVLILDGEEVVGGLQNRVVNTTLLIPAKTIFDLPVSCIEH